MEPKDHLKKEQVDLKKYPETIHDNHDLTITVGDMHGNTMKLIWILIKEGMIEITREDFDSLWELYEGSTFTHEGEIPPSGEVLITKEAQRKASSNLKEFIKIINKLKVKPGSHLRLLGDVLADRGMNDYLTLTLLKKLKQEGLDYEIALSNHDNFLLENYRKPYYQWDFYTSHLWIQGSMINLRNYIQLWIVKIQEVRNIIDDYVLPAIKVIPYTLSKDKQTIALFMHAPNDFRDLKRLARKLKLIDDRSYQPDSALELAQLIDKINKAFIQSKKTETPGDIKRFIWNRLNSKRPKEQEGKIDFARYPEFVTQVVHGHTTTPDSIDHRQINLDNYLGKSDEDTEGEYLSFVRPREEIFIEELEPTLSETISTHLETLDQEQIHNINKAEQWIKRLHRLSQNPSFADDATKLTHIIVAAENLLKSYIKKDLDTIQNGYAEKFDSALLEVEHIKIINKKNILNIFIFIPSLTNFIRTKGKHFWFKRKRLVKGEDFTSLLAKPTL